MAFKFAHIADCHLGSWNSHPDLKEMSILAFEKALDACLWEGVNFVLISGDLLDTAMPPFDVEKRAVAKLKYCADRGLRIYAIAGSHDFSPTGKTRLHIMEEAGLLTYVAKYKEEGGKMKLEVFKDRTGALICGIVGKKGSLDIDSFDNIDKEIEKLGGFKIFMFHSAIEELRPENMKDMPALSMQKLPKNFDYYASGHVHTRNYVNFGKGIIAFPNSLFPTEFPELEKNDGGFFIIDVDDQGRMKITRKDLRLFDVVSLKFSADGKTPQGVQQDMMAVIEKKELDKKALLIKVSGTLASGRPGDIDMKPVIALAQRKGAFTVKRNMSGLTSSEFEEIKVMENMSAEDIEQKLVKEHLDQMKFPGMKVFDTVISLMNTFQEEKGEDETNSSYESRISENAKKVLGL